MGDEGAFDEDGFYVFEVVLYGEGVDVGEELGARDVDEGVADSAGVELVGGEKGRCGGRRECLMCSWGCC